MIEIEEEDEWGEEMRKKSEGRLERGMEKKEEGEHCV